jgi:hypothetical protein
MLIRNKREIIDYLINNTFGNKRSYQLSYSATGLYFLSKALMMLLDLFMEIYI